MTQRSPRRRRVDGENLRGGSPKIVTDGQVTTIFFDPETCETPGAEDVPPRLQWKCPEGGFRRRNSPKEEGAGRGVRECPSRGVLIKELFRERTLIYRVPDEDHVDWSPWSVRLICSDVR